MKAHCLTQRLKQNDNQGTFHPVLEWSKKFLTDRRPQGLSGRTYEFYFQKSLYFHNNQLMTLPNTKYTGCYNPFCAIPGV
jgi:hypothetical protein